MNEMTVADLIALLREYPQDLPVAYRVHSEQVLMEADDIYERSCCFPRPDGWIQDARPDMPTRKYLMFPGN